MLSKIPKLPLPVNGLNKTSSQSSVGMPRALKIGERKVANKSVMPLILKSATAIRIDAIKGKISTTKLIAPFAPLTNVS